MVFVKPRRPRSPSPRRIGSGPSHMASFVLCQRQTQVTTTHIARLDKFRRKSGLSLSPTTRSCRESCLSERKVLGQSSILVQTRNDAAAAGHLPPSPALSNRVFFMLSAFRFYFGEPGRGLGGAASCKSLSLLYSPPPSSTKITSIGPRPGQNPR